MIILTRLNGEKFAINSDLVERIDATPDTVITLVDSTKYLVSESLEQVVAQVREFRASILVRAQGLPEPPRAEHPLPPVVSPPLRLVSPDGTREDV